MKAILSLGLELREQLMLPRCPHCSVHLPNLINCYITHSQNYRGSNVRNWGMYICKTCGGAVVVANGKNQNIVSEVYPSIEVVHTSLPHKAREFLRQAIESIHSPSGAIMLAASAVDAMLKERGYKEGALFSRIQRATDDNLLTEEMSEWAHNVRLDANAQRHADDDSLLPNENDARKCLDFTIALSQFLFVLPNMVQEGLKASKES